MKFFGFLCKFVIAVLAICGACYIFLEILDKVRNGSDDCEQDEVIEVKSFVKKVKDKADVQIARMK